MTACKLEHRGGVCLHTAPKDVNGKKVDTRTEAEKPAPLRPGQKPGGH